MLELRSLNIQDTRITRIIYIRADPRIIWFIVLYFYGIYALQTSFNEFLYFLQSYKCSSFPSFQSFLLGYNLAKAFTKNKTRFYKYHCLKVSALSKTAYSICTRFTIDSPTIQIYLFTLLSRNEIITSRLRS